MVKIGTNDCRIGVKIDMAGEPYVITGTEFVKPGKGQAFNRIKLKHLLTGRVVEKTYKSTEKLDLADVEETKMRMLYRDGNTVVFMHDTTFEQIDVPLNVVGDAECYLAEDVTYDLILYKNHVVSVIPPTFMEMTITETSPGVRGDTASGKVLKNAVTDTGAKVRVPIFIEQGERVKIDTRSGAYASRV